jgi:NADH-quinone oxidoreductase subunit H
VYKRQILAIASVGTYGVILAGWSSNNNYSILGALRTSAQMISYELPMGIILVAIVLTTSLASGVGSLSLVQLVEQPRPFWLWIWLWIGFPMFFICMLAETSRSPFDLPETENELVAGFQTEYGGIKFALFFMAEYIHMITASAIMVTVFFGGWQVPFVDVSRLPILGVGAFVVKVILVLFLFIWVRASVPRVRYDQLMHFCWKFLFPLSLIYLAITAIVVALVP